MLRFYWVSFDRFKRVNLSRFKRVNLNRPYWVCLTVFSSLLTAVLSPLANSALFGMPAAAVLPEILIKSVTLAVAAVMAARYLKSVSLLAMVAVVLAYQIIGSLFEWVLTGSFLTAMQDFRLGVPGMLLQIIAGYALLKWLAKR